MPLIDKIILGTAQFGLHYGINNTKGKPGINEVYSTLDYANSVGIGILDTAIGYGNAIDLIGDYHCLRNWKFNVISKFKTSDLPFDLNLQINSSIQKLQIDSFFAYLFHSYEDYFRQKDLLDILLNLKEEGKIQRIGVSLYTNEELKQVLDNNIVDLIQLPFNLLDNFQVRGSLLKIAKQKGIMIHTRSVFLQGLFFRDIHLLPEQLKPLKKYLQKIREVAGANDLSIASLALHYAVQNPYIDGVLIGVDSKEQLEYNIDLIRNDSLPGSVVKLINEIEVSESELLNPVNWI